MARAHDSPRVHASAAQERRRRALCRSSSSARRKRHEQQRGSSRLHFTAAFKAAYSLQEGGGTSLSSGDGRSSTLTSPEELKRFATTSTSPAGSKKSFSFF